MNSTLQAAFGVWPTDQSIKTRFDIIHASQSSTVNEGFTFHDEEDEGHDEQLDSDPSVAQETHRTLLPSTMESVQENYVNEQHPASQPETDSEEKETTTNAMELDLQARSPSPSSPDEDLDRQLKSLWSNESRKAFHDMVTADGYINRYRMHMKKRQRLSHYLEHPDLDPVLCDGSKDHQTKYQATNWTLIDGKLFRKPDVGRVGKLRRHLDEVEAWEVLTREHVLSGHQGRDKLRKRLAQRYIGYTLQEIMLVLKECRKCGERDKTVTATVTTAAVSYESTTRYGLQETRQIDWHPAYLRGQTSNMMWP